MRHVGIVVVALSLAVIVGCKQQSEPPQTMAYPEPQALEPVPPAEPTAPEPAPYVAPAPVQPAEPTNLEQLAPPAPAMPAPASRTYTIKKGDTLWSIAVKLLGNGQRWREIVDLNPGLEPTKLRIGQVITLPAQ